MPSFRLRLFLLPMMIVALVCLLGSEHARPLRYSGKTFEEWREELRTELDPEARAKGIKALITFGQNGRATEAMTVILEIVGPYDLDDEDINSLREAAQRSSKLGRPIIPQVVEALGSEKAGARALAKNLLLNPSNSRISDEYLKAEIPLLKRAVLDDNAPRVETVLEVLFRIDPSTASQTLILELLGSKNPRIRKVAVNAFWRLEPKIEPRKLYPILIPLLEDEDKDVRLAVINQLPATDVPREVVSPLCKILKSDELEIYYESLIYQRLRATGPAAKEAVPVMKLKWAQHTKEAKGTTLPVGVFGQPRDSLLEALQQIDPEESKSLVGKEY